MVESKKHFYFIASAESEIYILTIHLTLHYYCLMNQWNLDLNVSLPQCNNNDARLYRTTNKIDIMCLPITKISSIYMR